MTAASAPAGQALAKVALARLGQDLLAVYLNDHLAGATLGSELARRVAASHSDPGTREAVAGLAEEIREDRQSLLDIMSALHKPVRAYKVYAGWAAEKAGRLKPNGHLRTRSPLSNVEDLEGMLLGVQGKAAGWRTLRALAERDARLDAAWLDHLLERARHQARVIEELRVKAAQELIRLQQPPGGHRLR